MINTENSFIRQSKRCWTQASEESEDAIEDAIHRAILYLQMPLSRTTDQTLQNTMGFAISLCQIKHLPPMSSLCESIHSYKFIRLYVYEFIPISLCVKVG